MSKRSVLALPSKQVKSLQRPPSSSTSVCSFRPSPSEKDDMACSPECPNGGFPKSCARQAAETMRQFLRNEPVSSNIFPQSASYNFSRERPTLETSKLCVNRLCTKILPGKGRPVFCFADVGMAKKNQPIVIALIFCSILFLLTSVVLQTKTFNR